ncbi:MAG TPA: isoprenylcysteine carboxylmethyltransferase family protein [Candidatus Paceibacterota bacterium]
MSWFFDDWLFRLVLATLSAAIYVNHHYIHRSPHKAKGPLVGIEFWMVTFLLAWTLTIVLYALGLTTFAHAAAPQWLRWAGVGVMVACMPLSSWIYHTLGVHFSKKLELRDDHRLIDTGPYRFIRHPMYATLFLCATGVCLISANLFIAAATVPVAVVMLMRMRKEEAMLVSRFGEKYITYRQYTGALFPKLLQWRYGASA